MLCGIISPLIKYFHIHGIPHCLRRKKINEIFKTIFGWMCECACRSDSDPRHKLSHFMLSFPFQKVYFSEIVCARDRWSKNIYRRALTNIDMYVRHMGVYPRRTTSSIGRRCMCVNGNGHLQKYEKSWNATKTHKKRENSIWRKQYETCQLPVRNYTSLAWMWQLVARTPVHSKWYFDESKWPQCSDCVSTAVWNSNECLLDTAEIKRRLVPIGHWRHSNGKHLLGNLHRALVGQLLTHTTYHHRVILCNSKMRISHATGLVSTANNVCDCIDTESNVIIKCNMIDIAAATWRFIYADLR